MNYFITVIKSFVLLALACKAVMTPALLAAEKQTAVCFPANAAWGLAADQVIKLKGEPKVKPVISPGMMIYTYQSSLLNHQYEAVYSFGTNGLDSILYTFQVPPGGKAVELFISLESAVHCLFNLPGVRLDASKDEVEKLQALWEDDLTLAHMSFFSTLPHEVTLKFIDKKDEGNQVEVGLFQRFRERRIKRDEK